MRPSTSRKRNNSQLEDKSYEITQLNFFKEKKNKRLKKYFKAYGTLLNNWIPNIGVPEGVEREKA